MELHAGGGARGGRIPGGRKGGSACIYWACPAWAEAPIQSRWDTASSRSNKPIVITSEVLRKMRV